MPEPGSKRARRARPPSTTTRTSGIVSEVSAIAVASTSRRPVASGTSAAALLGERQSAVERLDDDPGREPRCQPRGGPGDLALARAGRRGRRPRSRRALRARDRPTASSKRGPLRAPPFHGRSSQRVSTGKARPSAVITGASSISAATGPASSVADMTRRRRSGRSAPRTSSASARPRSAWRARSWNSSKMMQPMPGKLRGRTGASG